MTKMSRSKIADTLYSLAGKYRHVMNDDDLALLNQMANDVYELIEVPSNMPHELDEWIKSNNAVINILLDKGTDSNSDFENQVILMKVFLKEFEDPTTFDVTSKNDIDLMRWLSMPDFNTTSNYNLIKSIIAILIGYTVVKHD